MSDERNWLERLGEKIPGYGGYVSKERRRDADKIQREHLAERLRAANRTVTSFAADLLVFFASTYRQVFGFPAPPVHDPCAVAAVLAPDILHAHMMHVEIETTGQWTAGRTVCDAYGTLGKEATVRVGYGLDVPRFWNMVIDTLLMYE